MSIYETDWLGNVHLLSEGGDGSKMGGLRKIYYVRGWSMKIISGSHEGVYVNFALEKGGRRKMSEFIAISTHPPPANIK